MSGLAPLVDPGSCSRGPLPLKQRPAILFPTFLPVAFARSVVEAFELLEHEWRAFPSTINDVKIDRRAQT